MLTYRRRHYCAAFLMNAALAVGLVAIPLLASKGMAASVLQLAVIQAVGAVAYVIGSPLFGHRAEKGNRKRLMLGAGALFTVTYLLMARSQEVWHLYVLSALSATSQAMFWPTLEVSLTTGATAEELKRGVGGFNMSWCTGVVLGLLIAGPLHDWHPRYPFVGIALMGLMVIAAIRWVVPGDDEHPDHPDLPHEPHAANGVPKTTFLYMGWTANFVAFGVLSVMRYLFTDVSVRLGFTGSTHGLLEASISVFQVFMFFLLRHTHGWQYNFGILLLVQLGMVVGAGTVSLASGLPALFTGFILLGCGAGMTYYSSLFYSLDAPSARGVRSGLHEAILGAGGFVIPLAGGTLAHVTGHERAPYAFCVAALLVGLAAQTATYWLGRRPTPT
ncbi:MAG: MFS transporter [Planctomycetes bacterium]|nr:MFS transporter [Planctomycetota bacterium]